MSTPVGDPMRACNVTVSPIMISAGGCTPWATLRAGRVCSVPTMLRCPGSVARSIMAAVGVSVYRHGLKEACDSAIRLPSEQPEFKTKRLNIWLSGGAKWISLADWRRCEDKQLRLEQFEGKRIRTHSWQFPQGGIDRGESPEQAMFRELHEEVGLMPDHVRVVARTRDWLRYEVPDRYIRRDEAALASFLDGAPGRISMLYRRDRATVTRVRDLIRHALPASLSQDDVAAQLHMSPRTLHRRLDEEGSSFRTIKEALRRDLALSRLTKTGHSIARAW